MHGQLRTGEMDVGETERRRKKDVSHSEHNVPEVAGIKCPKKLCIFSQQSWKGTSVFISASQRLCLHDGCDSPEVACPGSCTACLGNQFGYVNMARCTLLNRLDNVC
jgi:hypothetical protein